MYDQTDEVLHRAVEESQSGDMPVCCNCGDEIGDPDGEYRDGLDLYCADCIVQCANCGKWIPAYYRKACGWTWDARDEHYYCPDCQEVE